LLATALVLTACGTVKSPGQNRATGSQSGRSLTATVSAVTKVIVIDPQAGEKFTPPFAKASPALTPQEAWAKFMRGINSTKSLRIPADVGVQLGLLTLPIGPIGRHGGEKYTAHNELVYGYSWHSCPVSMNPNHPKLPGDPCIEWNFIDANTGHQIDLTWQQ
jgi:hypothetical protein